MPTEWVERQLAPLSRPPGSGLRGWHVLVGFVVFFLIVAGTNAVLLTAAIRTMPGLDARNGYDPSQAYNGEIAKARRQTSGQYRADVALTPTSDGVDVRFDLATRAGEPEGASAIIKMEHPSDQKRDVSITMPANGAGRFAGRLAGVAAGARNLIIEVRDASGSRIFLDRQRVMIGDRP
jgi:nitrogen fixation protein FixH